MGRASVPLPKVQFGCGKGPAQPACICQSSRPMPEGCEEQANEKQRKKDRKKRTGYGPRSGGLGCVSVPRAELCDVPGPPPDRDRRDCPLTCAPTSAPRAPAGASAPPSAGKGLPAWAAGAAGLPEPRARCPGRAAVCASARAGRSLGGRPPNALVKRASPALQPAGAAGSGTWPRRRGRPGVESRGPSGLTQLRGDPAAALGLAC